MAAPLRRAHPTMFGLAHHAALYDRFAARIAGPMYRRIAADVAALGLPPGASVVDVGTGPGRLPRLVAAACPDVAVQGVDLSPAMVELARDAARAAACEPGRPAYAVADVRDLPHADASVDLVVSSLSLHHWEDPGAGLREVARVLRPGGRAWIYDVRRALAGLDGTALGDGVTVRLERRLAGAGRLNPLARLVVLRTTARHA